jgi:SAM-dependent methyltransferase
LQKVIETLRLASGLAGGGDVADYVLEHHQRGERQRLALMSRLLDPMHRRHIERAGISPGDRTLEVGCGNGSMSAWLAGQVAPSGRAVAVDLDLSLADAAVPALELRQADIMAGPVTPADFDLVTCRAVLHHLSARDDPPDPPAEDAGFRGKPRNSGPNPQTAVANLIASTRPGGSVLLIEPDFLPATVAEPDDITRFWDGWLAWSRAEGIDYFIGRRLAPMLCRLGVTDIDAVAETASYNGGSLWADYWQQTVTELRPRLERSRYLDAGLIEKFLSQCADPAWWTQTIAFTCVHGRTPS